MSWKNALALAAGISCVPSAWAVDFGVMEAADVVEPGDFKFIAFPLAVRDSPRREQNSGVVLGGGYGFGRDLDGELQVAVYDDFTFYGADLEYTYRAERALELSISGGAHLADTDFGDPWGLDLTHVASYALPALPALRLNGALDLAYERADAAYASALGLEDQRYWTAHAVPGVQYRVTRDVDVIGEVGVGLNGESDDYIAAGLSYYFRAGPNSSASSRSPSSRTK
ncbi:MAG: hypothetical protein ACRES8_06145 [Nevskiaceae bacterium]